MKKILIYSVLAVLCATSCEKSETFSTNKQMVIQDNRLSSESFTVKEKKAGVSIKPEDLKKVISYLNTTFDDNMDEVLEMRVEHVDGKEERRNLILHLGSSKNDKTRLFAIVFEKVSAANGSTDDKKVIFRMAESHKCSGDPCTCCIFVHDDDGSIKGCKCEGSIWKDGCDWESGQKCNHTVST